MKKVLSIVAAGFIFLTACVDENGSVVKEQTQQYAVDMSDFYAFTYDESTNGKAEQGGKSCESMKVLNRQLNENPSLYNKMYNIEKHSRKFVAAKKPDGAGGGKPGGGNGGGGTDPDPVDDGLGLINIPVYVHVIYNNAQENISDAQINSQIAVLNDDFRKSNGDASSVPSEFSGVAADSEINFTLAAITRTASSKTSWGTNDAMKMSSQGGVDPITPSTHMNMWICNIGGGILGYAQFPGGSSSTDGVVFSPQYCGSSDYDTQGNFYLDAPFDKGRTATHEVGHYLNLRHIWGDGRCRQDDFVSDTPTSDAPNYGCPSYPTVNCKSTDMTMNYMDYTDDACMTMFSEGQKSRMRSIFSSGGARDTML